jgi:PAS domain S-box-containing protein
MSPHVSQIIVVSVMTLLVVLFTWTYLRERRQPTGMWMLGWVAILVHFADALLASYSIIPSVLADWVSVTTLVLAGTIFFLSVSKASAIRGGTVGFFSLISLPAIAYWTCLVLNVQLAWIFRALLLITLGGGVALAGSRSNRKRPMTYLLGLIWVLPGLWVTYEAVPNTSYGIEFLLFGLFAATGFLYWRYHHRPTPGVIFTFVSFVAWGLVFPAGEVAGALHLNIPDNSVLWDLPKYFVAFGMILTLFENQTEIANHLARQYRDLFEGDLAGVYVARPDGELLNCNAAFLEMYGFASKEEARARLARAADTDVDRKAFLEKLRRERKVLDYEYHQSQKDGTPFWVLERARLVPGPDGESLIEGTAIDITQRKHSEEKLQFEITERRRAEAALQERSGELERSNADLEQFAYVASHDLQEPLRMVASFTQLLAARYKGQLDTEADEFIAYAVEGATRMQTLIEGLLSFARVGTRGKELRPTDSQMVLSRSLQSLDVSLREANATVSNGALPVVAADESQLEQLFQNLIGNAVKFRGKDAPAVQVSAQRNGKEWIFSIKDNGIGIEPQYQGRIFVIFQRLHPRSEYPGTGIGLSICKKIVERHGGRIWVESAKGRGSTFHFTMPLVESLEA